MARLRRALPSLARCERPSVSVLKLLRDQPGRLAQGPDEKKGARGRARGFPVIKSILPDGRPSVGRGVPRRGMVRSRGPVKKSAPHDLVAPPPIEDADPIAEAALPTGRCSVT